jgi:hypothetical protein
MAYFLLTNLEQVLTFKDDLTANNDTWGIGNKAHDGKSTHTLATGTLTNETYALPLINIIREFVNCS